MLSVGQRGEAFVIARLATLTTGAPFVVLPADAPHVGDLPANNYIDEHVNNKLRKLRMRPSSLCSDEVFLRRVYIDIIGFKGYVLMWAFGIFYLLMVITSPTEMIPFTRDVVLGIVGAANSAGEGIGNAREDYERQQLRDELTEELQESGWTPPPACFLPAR